MGPYWWERRWWEERQWGLWGAVRMGDCVGQVGQSVRGRGGRWMPLIIELTLRKLSREIK